jgi:hypothetical protein
MGRRRLIAKPHAVFHGASSCEIVPELPPWGMTAALPPGKWCKHGSARDPLSFTPCEGRAAHTGWRLSPMFETNIFLNPYEQPENKLTYCFLSLLEHLEVNISLQIVQHTGAGIEVKSADELKIKLLYGGGDGNPDGSIAIRCSRTLLCCSKTRPGVGNST